MSKEEQHSVFDSTRRACSEEKQLLACLRMKADDYADRLRKAADAIESSEGEAEVEKVLKQVPSLGDLLDVNSQIRAAKGQISRREARLKEYDDARLR